MFYKRLSLIVTTFVSIFSLSHPTNAQTWTQLFPTGSDPTSRYQHSVVYDNTNNLMTVFGGTPNDNVTYLNDVWVLSTANGLGGIPSWTQLSPTGSTPNLRDAHTAVYDSSNNRMTIFGGWTGGALLNDVWVLSNANGLGGTPAWTQLSPVGGPPSKRRSHIAVYDTANNRMTIFGGFINPGSWVNDVWVLSNVNGLDSTISTWTQLSPTGSTPVGREYHTAVYDTTNNRMIIFGGSPDGEHTYLNDVWVLSNANGLGGTPAWTQLFPTGSAPTSRVGHAAVYDATNNHMTIFGGLNGNTTFNDVWVLSNANGLGGTPAWSQLLPTGSTPTTRFEHRAVYDATNNRMMIFGGGNNRTYFNDVWVLSVANGIIATPPNAGFYAVPTSGYVPLQVQFTDTSSNNPTSWSWSFGDGGTSTAENPSYSYNSIGTFNVQLIVSNANGTSTSIQNNYITVFPHVPSAGFYAIPTSGTIPLHVQFTDTSAFNPTSWTWSFGEGGTSTAENPSYSYNSVGTFTVQLIVNNIYGTSTVIATNSIHTYTISTVGEITPVLSNPPSLKTFIGGGLISVFNLEDYNSGGMGISYSIPTDFLSLGTTSGSYESQAIYDTATTGTNTYKISNDAGSSSASGLVKYSTYRIRKLPHVGLTPGSSWDVNVGNYTYNTSGLALPPSFGNPTSLSISDLSKVTAYWLNDSVVRITSLQSFTGAVNVDVTASPVVPIGTDQDRERIYVYSNLLSNSTFSTANDTSIWVPGLELPPGRSNLATQNWVSNYTDSAGTQANGVWQFTFTDGNDGVKATPGIANWVNISNGQWYTFRIRLVADSMNNSHQALLFGFTNFVGNGIQTDIVGNVLFGVPTVWTWQEAYLLAHGSSAAGYPQFQFKGGGAGSIYIDEIQILNAAPSLMNARSNTKSHYFYGQFTTGNDTTGWGQQLYPGAESAPDISVNNGLVLNFVGASDTALEGIKWTANNGVQGPLHAYSFPVNPNYDVNVGFTLSIQSGSFNSLGIVLAAAYGIQTVGQQDIGTPPSNLMATADVGVLKSGNYIAEGMAVNPYYQGQFGVRSDIPGILVINNVDVNVDNDDPNFGDASLFP